MTPESLFLAAAITWLAVISPGADFAIVSRNSAVYGRFAGIASSFGIASGVWLHVAVAVFGLALIHQMVPNLFLYIQLAGAGYLIYIGIGLMRAGAIHADQVAEEHAHSPARFFVSGLLTNSLNPKTSVFVVSLYAQVVGIDVALPEQLALGAFISASHLAWFVLIALFLSSDAPRAFVLKHQRPVNLVLGSALVLLGVLLFLNDPIAVGH